MAAVGTNGKSMVVVWLRCGTSVAVQARSYTKATELASAIAAADVAMSNATVDVLRKAHLNVTFVCTA